MKPRSLWLDALDWLQLVDAKLRTAWPQELPEESEPRFWEAATRLEMSTRDRLSDSIRALVTTGELAPMTDLETWMYRRRVEWACQLAYLRCQEHPFPDASLNAVLLWLLVESWESDGCIAFWSHAERDGLPHPEAPIAPDEL